jgi:hypothetical protein
MELLIRMVFIGQWNYFSVEIGNLCILLWVQMHQTLNIFVYIAIVKHQCDGIWIKYGIIQKIQNVSLFNLLLYYFY